MDEIITYLKAKYKPISLIVYGSYANGTNNLNSDFDALLICDKGETCHDHSKVNGIELDVFIYPKSVFESDYDVEEFVQVWDGNIIVDNMGLAKSLQEKVREFIRNYPAKSNEDNEHSLVWCEKMLNRTKRNDAEGLYRLHWLLIESLEIYFNLKGMYFFGPKKAIRQMEEMDSLSSKIYYNALKKPTEENLTAWLLQLKSI